MRARHRAGLQSYLERFAGRLQLHVVVPEPLGRIGVIHVTSIKHVVGVF